MKNKPYQFLIVLLSFTLNVLVVSHSPAQTENVKHGDSVNSQLLDGYNQNLKELEKQRMADSLKKAELENQFKESNSRDNLKNEKIQKQLQELNDNEIRRIADKKAKIDFLRANAKSYPVLGLFDDTLFHIYSKIGSFSASSRALAITERIQKLADDFSPSKDSIQIVEAETTLDIVRGETIIMSVSENDAIWNNTTKEVLADNYKSLIINAISTYKSETNLITIAQKTGLALLVIAILGIILFYSSKLFKWTESKIKDQQGSKIKGVTITNYTLFDAERLVSIFLVLNTLVKWLVTFTFIYISLPIIFGFFPWTQNFAQTLFGYVLNPLKKIGSGFWNYLPNLFTILVIFWVFRYSIKGLHFLKKEIENGKLQLSGFYPDWANPTFQILKVILYAFMFILIFPYLPGSDSPIFQGVSVFLGFLFTFGSAGSLSNVIAGIVLTYMRLFKIGDRVKIGEVFGDVIEKSMLVTRVRTAKNEIISIPNSTVMSSHTINYSNEAEYGKGLILHTTVTIGYDVPWKKIHLALVEAAERTPLLLKDPKPFVYQNALEDFYVAYQINAFTKEPNKQAKIYSDLHQNILDCCNEAGIEIMSPHYLASRDGNPSTIPTQYLANDNQPTNFNVNTKKD